jgi:2-polyprenyl-3-methyl-5-hydroxy-6-metoxy-1,4-benzoquinol methylase
LALNQKDNWDSHWLAHAESASHNPAQSYRFGLIQSELKACDSIQKVDCVVDLGCGNGDLIKKLSESFSQIELIGIEPSGTGFDISKAKNKYSLIIKSDITLDRLSDRALERADVVVCTEVLEHLDNPNELLLALSSAVKKGTKLLVTVPGGPRSKFDQHIGHRKHFKKNHLIELIEGSDFCCDYVKRSGFPGHNIYKVITIILGNILVRKSENFEATAGIGVISRVLNWLMEKSFKNSPFGWQLLAVATKK